MKAFLNTYLNLDLEFGESHFVSLQMIFKVETMRVFRSMREGEVGDLQL